MLNVKKTLTKILDLFNVPLQEVWNNVTISTSPGAKWFNIPISVPSGYKGISVSGVSVNYAECSINAFYWYETGGYIAVQIRNNYTSALSVQVSAGLLCYKIGGGYSIVSSLLSRLAERRWEYAECKEDSHQTDANGWNKLHHILRSRCRVGFIHFVGNMGVHILVWNNLFCRAESNYFKGRKHIITDKCYYGRENNNTSDNKLLFYGKLKDRRLVGNRQGVAISERGWSCA